eukprot:583376_1
MIHMIVLYELPPRRTLIYNPSTCLWCHSCNAQTFVDRGVQIYCFQIRCDYLLFRIFGATFNSPDLHRKNIDFERSLQTAFQMGLSVVICVNDYDSRTVSDPLQVV